jgi:[protein-PII] uridylyltransferase
MFYLVQRDGFHCYAAGIHSMKAASEAAKILSSRRRRLVLERAAREVGRRHVLLVAAMFHDVGKGRGGGHSDKGAELVRTIAKRIGSSDKDAADASLLVRSHLTMSMIAFRRDTQDEKIVQAFAEGLGTKEMLAMLYILTVADIRAIGGNVWTSWKDSLLAGLYDRACTALTGGGALERKRLKAVETAKTSVMRSLGGASSRADVEGHLAKLPQRYILSIAPDTIAAHLIMARDMASEPSRTLAKVVRERGCTEFSVVALDRPGLFAAISGIVSAAGANIVDAELFTTDDGVAIDVLWMTDARALPFEDPSKLGQIREELARFAKGSEGIDEIIGARLKRRLLHGNRPTRPPKVQAMNDVSASHTIIEIEADDRPGLLFTIASTFFAMGARIDMARISTHVDRVVDVFYVRDADGAKILDPERLAKMTREQIAALRE